MEKKFVNKKGGCICGAVKFNVTLDELPRVFSCHCIDCRKKIGGIMSIIEPVSYTHLTLPTSNSV